MESRICKTVNFRGGKNHIIVKFLINYWIVKKIWIQLISHPLKLLKFILHIKNRIQKKLQLKTLNLWKKFKRFYRILQYKILKAPLNQTIKWALNLSSSDCFMMETVNIQSPAADATVHFSSDGNNRLFRSSSMTNISLELNSETQKLQTPGISAESD